MKSSAIVAAFAFTALTVSARAQTADPGLKAVEGLNAAALKMLTSDDIKWVSPLNGPVAQAIISGDPTKPGLYVQLTKWKAGNNFSRPHFHPNDRFITVLNGTWWVGTGAKFDPASTKPMKAGSVVVHYGKQIHYDGAKDEDAILLIVGEGPATITPAEEK